MSPQKGYKRLTKEEIEVIKVGDKLNFGNGDIREVTGFSQSTATYVKDPKLVQMKDGDGKTSQLFATALVGATKETMDSNIVKCQYCGDLRNPSDIKQGTIISPNWKRNNYKSPPRNYCADKGCHGYDQMGHEG